MPISISHRARILYRMRHSWDITPRQAVALQRELAANVRSEPLPSAPRTIGGTDCAFVRGGQGILAVAVLLDPDTLDVLAESVVERDCTFPYVPGLLSFREAPAVLAAIEALPQRPDLLMVDGQGLAHPRRFGLACHVGCWLDLPAIGVAKSRLCGQHLEPPCDRGGRATLRDGGEVIGEVVRTRTGVRPLYVSIGHRVTLEEAVAWTLHAARRYRLPEPTRQADQRVARAKRERG